jgi:hypothetical protein
MKKIALAVLVIGLGLTMTLFAQQKQVANVPVDADSMAEAETQKHLKAFAKSGVPTPQIVEAALAKAKKENTIESWTSASRLANAYANVVDVLYEHYMDAWNSAKRVKSADKEGKYFRIVLDYEEKRSKHHQIRNDCFLNIAEIHLTNGNTASALSYAMTAVSLSGSEPNLRGEALIKKIIEYK